MTNSQRHWIGREGGSEVRARSQDIDLAVLVMIQSDQLLRQEKDEASPVPPDVERDPLNAFIPRFAGDEGFFVATARDDLKLSARPLASTAVPRRRYKPSSHALVSY